MNDIKPGWATSEFWTTLFLHAIAFIALVMAAFGHTFDGTHLQPLIPVAAMLASGIAQALYSHSRAKVKTTALLLRDPIK